MATKVWASITGNWNNANSWNPVGVPITGDDVIFPPSVTQSVTSGLDQTVVNLNTFIIEEGSFSSMGSAGDPLIIGATFMRHLGAGSIYLRSSPSFNIDQLIVDSTNWETAIQIESMPTAGITRLTVLQGMVRANGTAGIAGIQFIEMSYRRTANDAFVDFTGATTPPTNASTLYMHAGSFKSSFDVGLIFLSGGTVTVVDGGSGVTVLEQSGGIFDWQEATTMQEVRLLGGIFTTESDFRPKTISELIVYPGAIAILTTNVTVTVGGSLAGQPLRV